MPVVLPSEAYEEWKTSAQKWCLLQIDQQFKPLDEPLAVAALIHYKGRRPDLDNALSSIADCFQGLLWKDDNLIMSYDGSRLNKDNENPRVELVVRPYSPASI